MQAKTIFNRLIKYIDYEYKLPVYIVYLENSEGEVRWNDCICLSNKLKSYETKLSVLLHEIGHIELDHHISKKTIKQKISKLKFFQFILC